MDAPLLLLVADAAKKRRRADEAWKSAITAACLDNPIREVAKAAGISHQRVHQIIHGR